MHARDSGHQFVGNARLGTHCWSSPNSNIDKHAEQAKWPSASSGTSPLTAYVLHGLTYVSTESPSRLYPIQMYGTEAYWQA